MSRVFGLLENLSMAGLAAGSLLPPVIARAIGLPGALTVFGTLIPASAALGLRRLASADRTADVPSEVLAALARVPMFSALGPPTLESLARRGRIVEFDSGSLVLTEGELPDHVFLVVDGSLEVTKGGRRLAFLGPEDVVGEIAAIHRVPRTATVTSLTAATAVRVPSEAFIAAVRGDLTAWSLHASVAGRRLAEQEG